MPKFEIERTWDGPRGDQPCEKAVRVSDKLLGIPPHWEVEIDSLEDLLSLVLSQGKIIIFPPELKRIGYKIEIYDDFRE